MPGCIVPATPGNLLEKQILGPHSDLRIRNSGVGAQHSAFEQPARWLQCTLKLESRLFRLYLGSAKCASPAPQSLGTETLGCKVDCALMLQGLEDTEACFLETRWHRTFAINRQAENVQAICQPHRSKANEGVWEGWWQRVPAWISSSPISGVPPSLTFWSG